MGHRHIAEVTFRTMGYANPHLSALETHIRRGSRVDPLAARMLVGDWAQEWVATIVDLRPSTKAHDLGYLNRYVLPRFAQLELGDIDHLMVRGWVADLSASGQRVSAIRRRRRRG